MLALLKKCRNVEFTDEEEELYLALAKVEKHIRFYCRKFKMGPYEELTAAPAPPPPPLPTLHSKKTKENVDSNLALQTQARDMKHGVASTPNIDMKTPLSRVSNRQLLQDITNSAKGLRRTQLKRSPGGTPMKAPRSARLRPEDCKDAGDIITLAFRNRYKNIGNWSPCSPQTPTSSNTNDENACPTVNTHPASPTAVHTSLSPNSRTSGTPTNFKLHRHSSPVVTPIHLACHRSVATHPPSSSQPLQARQSCSSLSTLLTAPTASTAIGHPNISVKRVESHSLFQNVSRG